jgi:hypothetical protein
LLVEEKEKKRKEKKKTRGERSRKAMRTREGEGEEGPPAAGSRQCPEWGILRGVLELNFVGHSKLVQNPTADKPPRRDRAAACALATRVRMDRRSSEPVALIRSALCCPYFGQCNKIWRTVCVRQPQSQLGRTSGTCIEASQAFRPITSVRRSISAVAWCFSRLS